MATSPQVISMMDLLDSLMESDRLQSEMAESILENYSDQMTDEKDESIDYLSQGEFGSPENLDEMELLKEADSSLTTRTFFGQTVN